MKKTLTLILSFLASYACAQVTSVSSFQKAYPKTDNVVPYRLSDEGKSLPIEWGLDLAWCSEGNLRRGINFAGRELIDIVRVSYQPTYSVEDGQWHGQQLDSLRLRANWVKTWCKPDVTLNINDDHISVDKWYNYQQTTNTQAASLVRAERWAKIIRMAYDFYTGVGLKVVSISPFNESDYGWNQGCSRGTNNSGRKLDFLNICKILRAQEDLKGVRMCGGNTLNCDRAYDWWNDIKEGLDEGNTHQLAGDFNHYADFFKAVRAYGHEATNDELHNTMEAMVGVEYGLNRGIWWGTCEYSRSRFMQQSNYGKRLAYSENRSKWTAASIYRRDDTGKIQAFGGSSERQGNETTYRFVSEEKDVWYNGYGPQREYVMTIPGGTGYQQGQSNAETVVNVQEGEDIQPVVEGTFHIVNAKSSSATSTNGYALYSVNGPSNGSAIKIGQLTNTTKKNTSYQWRIKPVPLKIGDDFSGYYIELNVAGSGWYLDDRDWSLEENAQVIMYAGGGAGVEQWHLEYYKDGLFYLINRQSGKCMMPAGGAIGGEMVQGTPTGEEYQLWRLVPVGYETTTYTNAKLAAPKDLSAQASAGSIQLTWSHIGTNARQTNSYYASYQIVRRVKGSEKWQLIARDIKRTDVTELTLTFTDNTALPGVTYEYAVKTMSECCILGDKSEAVEATLTTDDALLAQLCIKDDLYDATQNGNHAASIADVTYEVGAYDGVQAAKLSGSNFLQLAASLPQHENLTIATWVKTSSTTNWQRIFDFGDGTDNYMFLSPKASDNMIRFAMKNGGEEQILKSETALPSATWTHLAVTIGTDGVKLYINGEENASSTDITIRPTDINTIFNYIGRSQFANDPFFNGSVCDFRVYNYALSALEVKALCDDPTAVEAVSVSGKEAEGENVTYTLSGRKAGTAERGVLVRGGKKILK